MIRYGISHRFQTPKYFSKTKFKTLRPQNMELYSIEDAHKRYSQIVLTNLTILQKCLDLCLELDIKAFRPPKLAPLATHETLGYSLDSLDDYQKIKSICSKIGKFCSDQNIRMTFQPDQHCVLGANKHDIVIRCIKELGVIEEFQKLMNISDIIILDLGNIYGSKEKTMERTIKNFKTLTPWLQEHLAFTNDRFYGPSEIIELCNNLKTPFVLDTNTIEYDIDYNFEELAFGFEPLARISSVPQGKPSGIAYLVEKIPFDLKKIKKGMTIEIEALYKEIAVEKVRKHESHN